VGHEGCPLCGSDEVADERPYRSAGTPLFSSLTVAVCASCRSGYVTEPPDDDALSRYYDEGDYERAEPPAAVEELGPWDLWPARAEAQVRTVGRLSGRGSRSWLDIGSGYGLLLDAARRAGYRTAGVDATLTRRERMERQGHIVYPGLSHVEGRWCVVSSSHFLEHLADPVSALKAQAGLLAPDGVVFIEVPNDSEGRLDTRRADEPHLMFFSTKGLTAACTNAGLAVRRVVTVGKRSSLVRMHNRVQRAGRQGLVPRSLVPLVHEAFAESPEGGPWIRAVASAATGGRR
jgi:SAM-dependent methyltransferase